MYKAGKTQNAINEFKPGSHIISEIRLFGKFNIYDGMDTIPTRVNFRKRLIHIHYLLSYAPHSKIIPLAYYSLGDAHYNAAQYDSAIAYYSMVIDRYPNSNYVFDAINGIQSSYVAKGDMESAVGKRLTRYVKQKKNSGFADPA